MTGKSFRLSKTKHPCRDWAAVGLGALGLPAGAVLGLMILVEIDGRGFLGRIQTLIFVAFVIGVPVALAACVIWFWPTRHVRVTKIVCQGCGYDLSGHEVFDAGFCCPECGGRFSKRI